MPRFRLKPGTVEAVQFDGNNWVEMTNFCGTRLTDDGYEAPIFNPIGTYLLAFFNPTAFEAKAELWSEYAKKHLYVKVGEWVVKGQPFGDEGFHLMTNQLFKHLYDPAEEQTVERL